VTLLRWETAKRQDRKALEAFQCTKPPRKRRTPHGQWVHEFPAPHEARVQSLIRKRLNPPCAPPHEAWIGWSDDGTVGAVVVLNELDGHHQVDLDVVAVHVRYRGRSGGWAQEAVRHALDVVTTNAHEAGLEAVEFGAWVHEDNRSAQRLLRSFGLGQTEQRKDDYQRYAADLIVSGGLLDPL